MIFKQFDIDYDKVTIDGIAITKPNYMSTKEWLDFWELFDGEAVDDQIEKAFNEGERSSEDEHEKELDALREDCYKQLTNLAELFIELVEDNDLSVDQKIDEFEKSVEESRKKIWLS